MPDTKISALPAVTTPALTDEFAVNQGGVSKKATLAQVHTLPTQASPGIQAADTLRLFAQKKANRAMLSQVGPSGLDVHLQPLIATNRIAMSLSTGAAAPQTVGISAWTVTGTATASTVTTTNLYTWMRRTEYLVTTAAITAVAGFYLTAGQFGMSNTAYGGGFFTVIRWGPATGVATATNRAFVGMAASVAAPTDVQPSSLFNILGMGWDSADANIQFMHNDASGTATKVDTGIAVPTVDRTNVYEIALFVPPNSTTVGWQVTLLNTGATASGTVSADIPAVNTLLGPRGYMSVGGTSSVIGISMMSTYIETDY